METVPNDDDTIASREMRRRHLAESGDVVRQKIMQPFNFKIKVKIPWTLE